MKMIANKDTVHIFHKKMYEMLDLLIDFFDKHNLQWFADSGTLLGCVRDGKMIDWDNDSDISMPIKDYVRFLELAEKEGLPGSLKICNSRVDKHSFKLNTTIVDANTTWFNTSSPYDTNDDFCKTFIASDLETCIFIDIVGIEHVPEKHSKFYKQYINWTNFMQDYLCYRWKHPEMTKTLTHEKSKALHDMYISTLLQIDEAYNDSEYVSVHNNVPITLYEDLQFKADWFKSYELRQFGTMKHKLRIPVGYANILMLTYGDDWTTEKHETHVGSIPYGFIFDVDKHEKFATIEDVRQYLYGK